MTKEQRDAAEGELIDLVRRNDAPNFRVQIECKEGQREVRTIDHDHSDPRLECVGVGATFAAAWQTQEPNWAKEPV